MINYALLLDTETSGLDSKQDATLELGAILYSMKHAAAVSSYSFLIPNIRNRHNPNPSEAVNGIPAELLKELRINYTKSLGMLLDMANEAEILIAHNAEFDRPFLPVELQSRQIICSKDDVEWPRAFKIGMSLVPLALAHGVGVGSAHRALADCDLMARLFSRVAELGGDLQHMLTRAMRPKATYLSLAPFAQKDLVKASGFEWNPERKEWTRRMFVEDAAKLGFAVKEVGT